MRVATGVCLGLCSLGAWGCAAEATRFTLVPRDDAAVTSDAGAAGDAVDASDGFAPVPIRDSGAALGCSEAAQLVYVLSQSNELYSFRPNLRQFTRIGVLRCPTSLTPNSMAIDRDAVAWVNYVDANPFGAGGGRIYRVNTTDASCSAAAPVDLPRAFAQLGMGFSTTSADTTEESLFLSATGDPLLGGSAGLARLDPVTLTVAPVGAFTGALRGQNAELTGTGDGRLYGFFTTTPVQVAQIDKRTGRIVETRPLAGVERPSAWAFSFWGGAFYLYTAPDALTQPARTSNVTYYNPADGTVDPAYLTNVGFRIVGAGVSTCAPVAPPP